MLLIELGGFLAGSFANGLNLVGRTTLRGSVDRDDLLILTLQLGSPSEQGDVNRDGQLDILDLASVAADFGRS